MARDVSAIVESYAGKIDGGKIFFRPNIPSQKLDNAIGAYARGAAAEEVLILVDNTTGGGAKDGALLTSTTLYSHNMWEASHQIDIGDIDALSFQEKHRSSALLVNGAKFLDMSIPSKQEQRLFAEMLQEIVEGPRIEQVEGPRIEQVNKSVVESLRDLKGLLDIGAITEAEYEQKRQKYIEEL